MTALRNLPQFDDFAKLHGDYVTVSTGTGDLLFADGARVAGGQIYDPPADPAELLRSRRQFAVKKLAKEEAEFAAFKQEVIRQAEYAGKYRHIPAPGESCVDDLKRGKARILALRQTIADIDKEMTQTAEAQSDRERYSVESQRQQRLTNLLHALKSIDV